MYDLHEERLHRLDPSAAELLMEIASDTASPERGRTLLSSLAPVLNDHLSRVGTVSRLFEATDANDDHEPHRLELVWFEVTDRCNLECVHCYAEAGPRNSRFLDPVVVEQFLQAFDGEGPLRIQLIGGEPFLHPGIWDIVDICRRVYCDAQIEIFSNLLPLRSRDVARIKEYGITLATSLYGSRAEIHDAVTGHRGSFSALVKRLGTIGDNGIACRIALVRVQQNSDDIEAAVVLGQSFGGSITCERRWDDVRPAGRAKSVPVSVQKTKPYALNLSPTRKRFFTNLRGHPCWSRLAAVTVEGVVVPCVFCRTISFGPVDGSSNAKQSHAAFAESTRLSEVTKCRDCELRFACFDCRALTVAEGLSPTGRPVRCDYDPLDGSLEQLVLG